MSDWPSIPAMLRWAADKFGPNEAAVGFAGETHHTGFSLGENIVTRAFGIGACEAVAGNGTVDEPGILTPKRLGIQAAALQGTK